MGLVMPDFGLLFWMVISFSLVCMETYPEGTCRTGGFH